MNLPRLATCPTLFNIVSSNFSENLKKIVRAVFLLQRFENFSTFVWEKLKNGCGGKFEGLPWSQVSIHFFETFCATTHVCVDDTSEKFWSVPARIWISAPPKIGRCMFRPLWRRVQSSGLCHQTSSFSSDVGFVLL